jgi:exodeoxyribonuclease VII small subunit
MEKKELSFEECLKQLEEIVARLESKDISLDDAVKYYQKGLELSKRCYEIFNQTQEVIVKKVEGSIITDFNQE